MANNKKNQITPSDWITFLQGEVTHTVSFIFPLYTALIIIYIALIQINQSVGSELFPTGLGEIIIALLFLLFAPAALIIWDVRPVNKLCKRIIKGELTTYEEILKEYKKIEKRNKFYRRKMPKKHSTNKKSRKVQQEEKTTHQESNETNWENDPAFVKYNK